MRSLIKFIGRLLQKSSADESQSASSRTAHPSGSPSQVPVESQPTINPVVFEAFERGSGGFHLKCRDAAGRSVITSLMERLAPQGNGWHVVYTVTGHRYQLYLTPQQVTDFQRALSVGVPTPSTAATPAAAPSVPPMVQPCGFHRSPQGIHLRFVDVQRRALVTSPIVRLEPLGNGWYTVCTSSGSRYRALLPAEQLAELQRLSQAAAAPPQPEARTVPTAVPEVIPPRASPASAAPTRPPKVETPHVGPPARTLSWAGAGTSLQVHGWTLPDPMLYWSEGQPREDEASCIELRLPVGQPTAEALGALGYWPRYSTMSPNQRANYLAWLASGRTAPLQDNGYVFVFFYGLERRALVDGQDLYPVLCEVVRLLEAYPASQSFQSYGRSFLAYVLAKSGLQNLSENWFEHLVQKPGLQTSPEGVAVALAWLALHERPLPAAWARSIASQDERSQQSVVVNRVSEQFNQLFEHKYAARFGSGLPLRCAKREHTCTYQPGSPSLIQHRNRASLLAPMRVPNVLGITSQFKPLVDLWNECIEELRPLSRQVGKGTAVTSRTAYDALPEVLQAATEHPDAARWQAVAARHRRESGSILVPIQELAPLLDFAAGTKLTVRQGQELAATAQHTGFAIEPDVRVTRRAYSADDLVVLYREDRGNIEASGGGVYAAAALILELGLAMAAADGEIDPAEVAHVTQFIKGQFELTPAQTRRLQALQGLFLERAPTLSGVGTRLQALLTAGQREQLATFLIGVAAANGTIDRAEIGLLRKAARALGLDTSRMDGLIAELVWTSDQPVEVQRGSQPRGGEIIPPRHTVEGASVPQIELNEELLRSIMLETQHVAQMLTAAMGESEETVDAEAAEVAAETSRAVEPSQIPSPTLPVIPEPQPETVVPQVPYDLTGLDPRYHVLAAELLARESWPVAEFQALIRGHGLFPAGAVDVINEWAEEYLGDLLIEEGDPYCIQRELVKEQA